MFYRQAENTNNLPFPQTRLLALTLLKYRNYWSSFKNLYVKLGSQTIEKIKKSSHQIEGDPGKACDVIILVSNCMRPPHKGQSLWGASPERTHSWPLSAWRVDRAQRLLVYTRARGFLKQVRGARIVQ